MSGGETPRFWASREKEATPVPTRRVPCFRRFSRSRFTSLLLISARPSPPPDLTLSHFLKARSMAVAHSGNLSLGGVMDTMHRGASDACRSPSIQTEESYKTCPAEKRQRNLNNLASDSDIVEYNYRQYRFDTSLFSNKGLI